MKRGSDTPFIGEVCIFQSIMIKLRQNIFWYFKNLTLNYDPHVQNRTYDPDDINTWYAQYDCCNSDHYYHRYPTTSDYLVETTKYFRHCLGNQLCLEWRGLPLKHMYMYIVVPSPFYTQKHNKTHSFLRFRGTQKQLSVFHFQRIRLCNTNRKRFAPRFLPFAIRNGACWVRASIKLLHV